MHDRNKVIKKHLSEERDRCRVIMNKMDEFQIKSLWKEFRRTDKTIPQEFFSRFYAVHSYQSNSQDTLNASHRYVTKWLCDCHRS